MRDLTAEIFPGGLYCSQIRIDRGLAELKPERVGNGGRVAAEGVTGEEVAGFFVKDHDRPRGVPRSVVDYQRAVPKVDAVAVVHRLKVLRDHVIGNAAALKQTLRRRPVRFAYSFHRVGDE